MGGISLKWPRGGSENSWPACLGPIKPAKTVIITVFSNLSNQWVFLFIILSTPTMSIHHRLSGAGLSHSVNRELNITNVGV